MSPDPAASPPRGRISPEQVAAVLAAVKAALEEEEAAGKAPTAPAQDPWVAAGRPGRAPRGRRPGPPRGREPS
jgi:hypothetical protein